MEEPGGSPTPHVGCDQLLVITFGISKTGGKPLGFMVLIPPILCSNVRKVWYNVLPVILPAGGGPMSSRA